MKKWETREQDKDKKRKEIKNDTKIVQERSQQEMYSQISKAKKCNLLIKQRSFLLIQETHDRKKLKSGIQAKFVKLRWNF